jgi:hypothetical protein
VCMLVRNTISTEAVIESIIKEYTIEDGFTITFTVIHNNIRRAYKLSKSIFA